MEKDSGSRGTEGSIAMTALKLVIAVVFIGGMTFALVVGYAHFQEEPKTPQFEKVEGYEFRYEVVGDWENPGPNHDEYNRTKIERLVVQYTNEERVKKGLPKLNHTDAFTDVARSHSADMANNGYLGHVDSQGRNFTERMEFKNREEKKVCMSPEGRQRIEELEENSLISNIPNPSTGENAGVTFYETPERNERTNETVTNENEGDIARTLVDSWMASPTHRENILREKWNAISVGVYASERNTVFATQVFCSAQVNSSVSVSR